MAEIEAEDRHQKILVHQGLVEAAARRLQKSLTHVAFDDLKSTGQFGLISAIDTYDPDNAENPPFRVWTWYKVRGAILDAHRRRHYRNDTRAPLEEDTRTEQPNAEEQIVADERLETIEQAYRLLPERSRIALRDT